MLKPVNCAAKLLDITFEKRVLEIVDKKQAPWSASAFQGKKQIFSFSFFLVDGIHEGAHVCGTIWIFFSNAHFWKLFQRRNQTLCEEIKTRQRNWLKRLYFTNCKNRDSQTLNKTPFVVNGQFKNSILQHQNQNHFFLLTSLWISHTIRRPEQNSPTDISEWHRKKNIFILPGLKDSHSSRLVTPCGRIVVHFPICCKISIVQVTQSSCPVR